MKLGAFGRIADYEKMKKAGYDYAELDMPEIEALDEKSYKTFQETAEKTGLPILTGARLFPVTDRIFMTAEFDPIAYKDYVKHTCKRSAGLGIHKIIMGNGKARSLITEGDLKYESKFVEFLRMICEIAGENGQQFILEPLGPRYSNYLNTLPQVAAVLDKVNMPNSALMADLRHMVWNDENFHHISACGSYLAHIHMDFPLTWPERPYPKEDDGYNYQSFIEEIKASGYDDTLTIEADVPKDWEQACSQEKRLLKAIL